MQASRMRLVGGIAALALVAGSTATVSLAQAEPPAGRGEGAFIERGECEFSFAPFLGFCTFTAVDTPSGNALVKAQGALFEGIAAPKKTVHIRGFECFTLYGNTTNSRASITPSGRFHVTCVVKHPKPAQAR
jgi:hypothetical protein